MSDLVSVLVPVYNTEKYISESIKSIVSQTYTNVQFIIVAVGSTVDSYGLCIQNAEKDSRIIVVKSAHLGVSAARNKAVELSSGDVLFFVDSDDWIDADTIELLLKAYKSNNFDFVACSIVIDENGSSRTVHAGTSKFSSHNREEIVKQYLELAPLHGSVCNKLIRSDLIKYKRFNTEYSFSEDSHMIWEILKSVRSVGILDVPLYHYRMNPNSITHQTFGDYQIPFFRLWQKICIDVMLFYPKYEHIAKGQMCNIATYFLYKFTIHGPSNPAIIKELRVCIKRYLSYMCTREIFSVPKYIFALISVYAWIPTKYMGRLYNYVRNR